MKRHGLLLAGFLALTPSLLWSDVLVLRDGDRITGRIERAGKLAFRLRTPYGVLTVPRKDVITRVHQDGREENIHPDRVAAPVPAAAPPPRRVLLISIRGSAFWQAWDPRDRAPDTRLRFHVTLDRKSVASYVDATLDDDIPGALVNTFAFVAGEVEVQAGTDVLALPPEARPGEARLRIELPPGIEAGPHELRAAYQVNEGEAAHWRDVVSDTLTVPGGDAAIVVTQDRGRMEWSRRRMKDVGTFRLDAGLQ